MVVLMLRLNNLVMAGLGSPTCAIRLDHKSSGQRVQHGHRSIIRGQDLIVPRRTDNLGTLRRPRINYHRTPSRTVGNLDGGARLSRYHQTVACLVPLVRQDIAIDRIDYLSVAVSVLNQHIALAMVHRVVLVRMVVVVVMAAASNYNILMKCSVVRRGRGRRELLLRLVVVIGHNYQLPICIHHDLAAGVRSRSRPHRNTVLDDSLLAICIGY